MPYKHNTNGRHHIPKMRHVVTNWPQYDAGLRRRGCLTLWITNEAIDAWAAGASMHQRRSDRQMACFGA